MTNVNEQQPSNTPQGWNQINAVTLYNRLRERLFSVWKLGHKHYLLAGNNVIDLGNYNDFWRGLCDHRILHVEDTVTGRELCELIRLCKRYATNLKQLLIQEGREEDLAVFNTIRGNTERQKQFLRSWL